ncbi:palladin [Garra rufa]|uniref:palladin n=1 Tax=Garra rufa TaxID=137080 RepID=UPI003CCE80DC
MQDGSWNNTLPLSLLMKEACPPGGVSLEGDLDGEVYLDSMAELEGGDGDFPELSAFLSQDEINLSLDLAREAMSDAGDPNDQDEPPVPTEHLPLYSETKDPALPDQSSQSVDATSGKVTSNQNMPLSRSNTAPESPEKFICQKSITPVYKQDRPRLVHGGLELNERAASATEFCSRAATFIEELSSIFKGSTRVDPQCDGDSSSPDSGYLSPRSHRLAMQQAQPPTSSSSSSEPQQEGAHQGRADVGSDEHQGRGVSLDGLMSPPRFTQKLKSQEVAEGSPIRLECRVTGNPLPLVRWFCEGRELHHCPDIQICRDGDLHTLVITEAFEDDTGRYTCVASNALGADNTSAEVYIEGASSSDSEGEGSVSKSRSGAMPQAQKKTSSVSLTIQTSSPKSPEAQPHRSTLVQPLSTTPQRVQSPVSSLYASDGPVKAPPTFTKMLQDAQASEGQVVVLECRVRGSLPLQVQWFREGQEIQDSPDFRILQKKPRSAAEPEEICTLVIAEAFPEDGGLFCCTATNEYGSVNSTAQLTVTPVAEESPSNGLSGDDNVFEDSQLFPPPPPPPTEISLLEVPPKTPPSAEAFQINELDIWPSVAELPVQVSTDKEPQESVPDRPLQNGQALNKPPDESLPSPSSVKETAAPPPSPSAVKAPPLPTKPKPKLSNEQADDLSNERLSSICILQRLTYEEKMARRLLGADNAATVFNTQQVEEEPVTQEGSSAESESVPQKEYKVSSFEQRLISEIEFRLERSPVEESDDDVQHDEDAPGEVAPSFDQKLKHYKVFEGMPVTFSCKVMGDPKPKVYWFKDGKQISKRSEHYRISRDPDGTCSLHTAAASLDDDGNYTIMAGNPVGRVSCTGRMMVQAVNQRGRSQRSTPGHIRRPRSRSRDSGDENENIQERHFRPHFLQAPGDLIVQEGKLCRMDCKVSGLPTPDLIWQLNGQTIRPDSSHKMLVRENGVHSLVIEPVTSRDAGVYTCIASNRAGQNSFNLELIVAAKEMHKAPCFIEKLQNTSVAEGHPVRLECRVSGVPFPQIFWKKENESFTHNTDRISMHQDNFGYLCMIIQPALKEDAGWYTVSAKNEAGIISSTARLDVNG